MFLFMKHAEEVLEPCLRVGRLFLEVFAEVGELRYTSHGFMLTQDFAVELFDVVDLRLLLLFRLYERVPCDCGRHVIRNLVDQDVVGIGVLFLMRGSLVFHLRIS